MEELTAQFEGFGLEFSLSNKLRQAEWNDERAEEWRAAALAALRANSTDAAWGSAANITSAQAVAVAPSVNATSLSNCTQGVCEDEVFEVFEGTFWSDSREAMCRGRDRQTAHYVLQANMLNPQEHCRLGWVKDVCLTEGQSWTYTISMAEQPDSDVTLTVSGKYLQTPVTRVFTAQDYSEPHEIQVNLKDNMAITGHYWMELEHTFVGGVAPVGTRWGTGQANTSVVESGHVCTARSKDRCVDTATAWSHARPPRRNDATGWSPGLLYSDITRSFLPLKVPILILENDKYELHDRIGEIGRKYRLHSKVEGGRPAWRGPFTLGPSFFSANVDRCPEKDVFGSGVGSASCMDGLMWDTNKKRLTTTTVVYPPAPPIITECTIDDCSSTGEDPGFWLHDPSMQLPDAVFRLQGPPGSVDTMVLKTPQNKLFLFRPCYVEPPGLPSNFYELNNF